MYFAIRLHAPQDENGNPRRGVFVYRVGKRGTNTPLFFGEEGYRGRSGVPDAILNNPEASRAALYCPTVLVSEEELSSWLTLFHEQGAIEV